MMMSITSILMIFIIYGYMRFSKFFQLFNSLI